MMNKISVIGTGYVGLVSGACFSEFGLNVICMDVDQSKIDSLKKGIIPIYEPGLEDLVAKNVKDGRLSFTTDIEEAITNSTVIFIAVGTPPLEDGSADLKYVLDAAKSIAKYMDDYKVIVNKSTVPIGTGKKVANIILETLNERGVNVDFDVVSNPEFLREGSAINDFMHPDRIVIGTDSIHAKEIMQEIYRVLYINNHPFVFTNTETAEMIKYAANAFLATKITFINEVSRLCEVIGADVKQVSNAIGLDKRIGKYFLHAGPGYGGSCFPKDTHALTMIGDSAGIDMKLVKTVIDVNEEQKIWMAQKVISEFNNENLSNKKIAVLGLAFKPETDDVRESPAITIIEKLLECGCKITAFDPAAASNAKKFYLGDNIEYAENEYDAAKGADALLIVTEWNQFRSINLYKIKELMAGNLFFDLRNIYDKAKVEEAELKYFCVGR